MASTYEVYINYYIISRLNIDGVIESHKHPPISYIQVQMDPKMLNTPSLLTQPHPSWNGSKYNVMIEWENGEIMNKPLSIMAADDPVACTQYAYDNKLLHLDGWKCFHHLAKNHKKMAWQINQAKLWSYHKSVKYKFG